MLHREERPPASSPLPDDRQVNELLARLHSAMSIDSAARAPDPAPEPSTSAGWGAGLLSSSLSLASDDSAASGSCMKGLLDTSSQFSSTSTLQDDAEIVQSMTARLESPTQSHQGSTLYDVTSLSTDSTPRKTGNSSKQKNGSSRQPDTESIASIEQKTPWNWNKKKKDKKLSKTEKEKIKKEMEMWNASDSTVLENLLNNKGSVSKWQAVATARGLCTLSNGCRCVDCQSSYVTFDNDGDGGMTEMAVGACVLQ